MGLSADGQILHCDNYGCTETTQAPVALYPDTAGVNLPRSAARGWLFMSRRGVCNHYCPRCAPLQLRRPDLPNLQRESLDAP